MKNHNATANRGFSLIELMVGMAVSLTLMAIASSIFVGGVRSGRVQEEKSKQAETAQLVLELLGREIRTAGFFPAFNPGGEVEGSITSGFPKPNLVNPASPAYDYGIYACDQAAFDQATGQCLAPTAGAPDTLIINYFSDDTFPQTAGSFPGPGSGTRRDCLNSNVETPSLPHNLIQQAKGLPVFVTNIYSLSPPRTYTANNGTLTTRSFGCWPLTNAAQQPFFEGVEQLRFRFGLFDNTTYLADKNYYSAPAQYYTTQQMNSLGPLVIAGENVAPWSRVVSIEVCLQTRSLENNARQAPGTATFRDCDDQEVTYASLGPSRPIVAISREIFNVRNATKAAL
jgi:type IV pilus assembly protein PilW